MNDKRTLKRLEGLAQRRQRPRDEQEQRERERLDAMTDEELARDLEAFARVLRLVDEDDEAAKLEGLVDEWTNEG